MDNPKTFKFFLENFNKIQPCEEINLTMACDFWLACSKYVLLDIFNNEAYQYSSYLVWPVQYYFQIEDVTSKVCNKLTLIMFLYVQNLGNRQCLGKGLPESM